MLDTITSADFQPLLRHAFDLSLPTSEQRAATVRQVELIEVGDLGAASVADRDRRHPFSLIFREAGRAYSPQGIYRIEHPAFGALDLFLVPIGPDSQGMLYQAIFN